MTSYEGSMTGADNVAKGGATNGGTQGDVKTVGGSTIPAIVGASTPTIVKTGATNNG
jgi:hypothetical protein